MAEGLSEALLELQRLTERLRRECPWDREQTAATIVPHTVEESYEVADAALAGDDEKLLDELGDLLFQVYFLALLLEERNAGDLRQVTRSSLLEQECEEVDLEEEVAELVEQLLVVTGESRVRDLVGLLDRVRNDARFGLFPVPRAFSAQALRQALQL